MSTLADEPIETPLLLVVEDTPLIALVVEEALSDAGFQVLIAEDGLDAIKQIEAANRRRDNRYQAWAGSRWLGCCQPCQTTRSRPAGYILERRRRRRLVA